MIEEILASKSKTRLLAFFFRNPNRAYFVGQLKSQLSARNLAEDLSFFVKNDILYVSIRKGLRYYRFNKKFVIDSKIRSELLKYAKRMQDALEKIFPKIPKLKMAVLSGLFMGNSKLECDLLLVGDVSKKSLNVLISKIEKLAGQEIVFALLTLKEFEFRKNIFDKFIKDIFENEHLVMFSKLKV